MNDLRVQLTGVKIAGRINNEECCVCLENLFTPGTFLRILPCAHTLHRDCDQNNGICPIC